MRWTEPSLAETGWSVQDCQGTVSQINRLLVYEQLKESNWWSIVKKWSEVLAISWLELKENKMIPFRKQLSVISQVFLKEILTMFIKLVSLSFRVCLLWHFWQDQNKKGRLPVGPCPEVSDIKMTMSSQSNQQNVTFHASQSETLCHIHVISIKHSIFK